METIKEAKIYLKQNYEKGAKCPCCGQNVKLYKRKLNSGMAYVLIHIYKQDDWINVKDYLRENKLRNNHDWTLLKYWGLIEEKLLEEKGKAKSSGVWRITELGKKFVECKAVVNKYVLIYNTMFRGFTGEEILIPETLKSYFNYNELMRNL